MTDKKLTKTPSKNKFTPPKKPTTSMQYQKAIESKRPTFRPQRTQGRGR